MLIQETIDYTDGQCALQGLLRYDTAIDTPAPGIVVFHEFMGLGAYLERHLQNLAGLGYVVLAADMYGKGIRPADAATALGYSRPLRDDRPLMRQRARAALDCLRRSGRVAPHKIAAVGYSFGGCVALELARSGADIRAAVSFYGYLETPNPAAAGGIGAKLLVFHGMHDPIVPVSSLAAYCQEVAAAGADSRVVTYDDAGHGVCNREMDGTQETWNRYSRTHDERSWQTLVDFLDRVLEDSRAVYR